MNDELKKEVLDLLESIVNGCVHPDIAVRRISVELAPIREMIKKLKNG